MRKLLVGLGNPGSDHARQRHNIGFMALDAIAQRHGFPAWKRAFQGEVAETLLGPARLLLLKPMTFMNLSGDSVRAAAKFFEIPADSIIVFHDELDLAPARVRIKKGGGHAGHNGLRSISGHLGPDFWRVRLGIGHPGDKARVQNHVLGDFAVAERIWVLALLGALAQHLPWLAEGNAERYQQEVTEALARELGPDLPPNTPRKGPPPSAAG